MVDNLEPLVLNNEPRLALDGGIDGLDAIRSICSMAPHVLAPGGWLLIEHHHNQSNDVARLLQAAGLIDLDAAMDLEGKLRFAIARAPGGS